MKINTFNRPLKDGKSKVWIDYSINGKRFRKKTDMYLYDVPKNLLEKNHNKETKKLMTVFISQLTIKLQNEELGIRTPKKKIKDFLSLNQV